MIVYKLVEPINKRLYSPFAPMYARVRYVVGKKTYPREWLKDYGIFAIQGYERALGFKKLYTGLHLYEAETDDVIEQPLQILGLLQPKKLRIGFHRLSVMTLPEINLVLGHRATAEDFGQLGRPLMESIFCRSLTLTRLVGKGYSVPPS